MTETLLFFGIGSLVTVCAAALVVSALALRTARRYVELAEERMEHLRQGQVRLMELLIEQRRTPAKEPEQELHVNRAKREPLEVRTAPRHREIEQENSPLLPDGPFDDATTPGHPLHEETPPDAEAQEETGTGPSGAQVRKPAGNKGQRRAVWHPHPDDDIDPEKAGRSLSNAPVEMFRRHYDKYLENYEGYVRLAERIYRMREESGAAPDSPAGREWEEKLRRVNDGIKRTITRLDILEEYNPELATDDRISHRASIARSHWELERGRLNHRQP